MAEETILRDFDGRRNQSMEDSFEVNKWRRNFRSYVYGRHSRADVLPAKLFGVPKKMIVKLWKTNIKIMEEFRQPFHGESKPTRPSYNSVSPARPPPTVKPPPTLYSMNKTVRVKKVVVQIFLRLKILELSNIRTKISPKQIENICALFSLLFNPIRITEFQRVVTSVLNSFQRVVPSITTQLRSAITIDTQFRMSNVPRIQTVRKKNSNKRSPNRRKNLRIVKSEKVDTFGDVTPEFVKMPNFGFERFRRNDRLASNSGIHNLNQRRTSVPIDFDKRRKGKKKRKVGNLGRYTDGEQTLETKQKRRKLY